MSQPAPWISFDEGPEGAAVRFEAPRDMIIAQTPAQVPAAMAALRQATAQGYWLAGYGAYELGYVLMPKLAAAMPTPRDTPLMAFGVFDAPKPLMPEPLTPGATPGVPSPPISLAPQRPVWDQAAYGRRFDRIKAYIEAGDIYQANLTFPIQCQTLTGAGDLQAMDLYDALQARQPVRYGACLDFGIGPKILSRSPELFFRTDAAGRIETRPMKGTAARHKDAKIDAAQRIWLQNDAKNRAENLMIVDLLRNDISRIAEVGSVKVPELFVIETYETLHQMVSRITAQLRPGIGLPEILKALFPCGSITGAPKLRAMQILRDLEPAPRGIYCGTIGWMAPDGASCFNVAIRTLSLFEDQSMRLNVGGGIVYDSQVESEYEEALWKARFAQLRPPT